ncbi:MAG: hypothetical protein HOW73_16560 [Polyangiaceae bacterium]|nr:hypothetical protein [Polyangiaceae bacterium]
MVRWLLGGVAAIAVGSLFVACGPAEETLCNPGDEVFCKCRGGFDGTKTCKADGNSFEECTTPEGACPEIPDSNSTTSGPTQICIPNEEVPCTCDDTTEGTKICAGDGLSFGDCTTASGPCGTTTTGDKVLYDACASGSECQTGVCDGGYCTRSCEDWTVCYDDANQLYGDCIVFDDGQKQQCAPYCTAQDQCAAFGELSLCGGAVALDDPQIGFAACADWGAEVSGMPYGTICDSSTGELFYLGDNIVAMPCDIGLPGVQNVCVFEECTKACETDDDCPNLDCTDTQYPCCASDPDCQ